MEDENVPVESVSDENLKVISDDLKVLIKFLQDKEQRNLELEETEKITQTEIEKQENDLAEQKELEKKEQDRIDLEQQEKDLKEEQSLLDSENEFRANLIDSLSLQNEKMDTYIQKSDGLSESIESINETTAVLVQNTEVSENELYNQEVTYYADLAILVLVTIFIPTLIMAKFFWWLFGLAFKNIL